MKLSLKRIFQIAAAAIASGTGGVADYGYHAGTYAYMKAAVAAENAKRLLTRKV